MSSTTVLRLLQQYAFGIGCQLFLPFLQLLSSLSFFFISYSCLTFIHVTLFLIVFTLSLLRGFSNLIIVNDRTTHAPGRFGVKLKRSTAVASDPEMWRTTVNHYLRIDWRGAYYLSVLTTDVSLP